MADSRKRLEKRLDEASRIELGFPHDFLRQMMPKSVEDHRA